MRTPDLAADAAAIITTAAKLVFDLTLLLLACFALWVAVRILLAIWRVGRKP